jgi:hypothetical protein
MKIYEVNWKTNLFNEGNFECRLKLAGPFNASHISTKENKCSSKFEFDYVPPNQMQGEDAALALGSVVFLFGSCDIEIVLYC